MARLPRLRQRAVTLINDGDFDGATGLLDEARTLTTDRDLLARIDLTRAFIRRASGP